MFTYDFSKGMPKDIVSINNLNVSVAGHSKELEKRNLHSYLTIPIHHGKLEAVLGEITGHLPDEGTNPTFESQRMAAIEAVAAASTDPDASDLLLERTRRVLASVYWMTGKNKRPNMSTAWPSS